ncbi:MAG: flagellar basal body-associated FliL family protein [Rhodospirillales bacterium]|nr:flagellar basal body-associated FliL family protein [Rhodospirillales bacterium]
MANTAEADNTPEDGEDAGGAPKRGGKKRLFIIVGAVLLLAIGGGAGAFFMGVFDSAPAEGEQHADGTANGEHGAAPPPAPEPVYYAIPELVVSLNTGERRTTFLKVVVNLQLESPADEGRIEQEMPRILDYCQVYLRELRPDDLRGSAGSLRLREELLRRISTAVAPVPVRDVLFKDLFVQ